MKTKFFNRLTIKVALFVVLSSSVATSCSAYPSNANKRDNTTAVKDSVMRKALGDSVYTVLTEAKAVTAPSNYVSNDTVYGKYVPNFSLTFNAAKGQSCVANFDFGLGKWNICDSKGKEIVRYDLPTTDVLRLANQLFPECKYFSELLNMPKQ